MNREDTTRSAWILRVLAVMMPALVVSAGAQAEDPVLRLTLEDVISRADAENLRVAELEARVDAATAAEEGRRAAERPVVSLASGYTRTNHVDEFALTLPGQPVRVLFPDVPDNYRARLDLQWPIYTAGRTGALAAAAGAEREAAAFDVVAARADARLDAVRAFWALVTAMETEAVLSRALESVDAHVRELEARLEQGFIPPNEVLSAEAVR
jgi:outer membrane protein TolC